MSERTDGAPGTGVVVAGARAIPSDMCVCASGAPPWPEGSCPGAAFKALGSQLGDGGGWKFGRSGLGGGGVFCREGFILI